MKRIKSKEHTWRRNAALMVTQYRITSTDGNRYYVFAHNFGDLELIASKIDIATYSRDCEDHFENRKNWTCMCKPNSMESIKKPFWWYGRVYLVPEN